MAHQFADHAAVMRRAIELAGLGTGRVEPNPAVGAVIVDDELRLVGEGYHEQFGGPHAEIQALREAGIRARGATLFVTLEPCCHVGKTGPCTTAVIQAGIRKVVAAISDPAPHVAGKGFAALRDAGVDVEIGLLADEACQLAAPFIKLVTTGMPFVHAKWAMSLDGKIAARTGDSRWISNERCRWIVHALRGRMDAVIVGAGTARTDDPLLTARPPGARTATRIVVDSQAALAVDSQLVRTARDVPVIVAATSSAPDGRIKELERAGVEVLRLPAKSSTALASQTDLAALLGELGKRQMTNMLVEGGGTLLGAFFDAGLVDAAHVFIAPMIIGGSDAVSPVAGLGVDAINRAFRIDRPTIEHIEDNVYVQGMLSRDE